MDRIVSMNIVIDYSCCGACVTYNMYIDNICTIPGLTTQDYIYMYLHMLDDYVAT